MSPSPQILMIGYDDRVLLADSATEDTRARHLRYAESVGHLHMLVWATHVVSGQSVSVSPKLTVYPVGHSQRLGRLAFLWQAWQMGRSILRQNPIALITAQDPFFTALLAILIRPPRVSLQIQNHSDFLDNPHWLTERPLWNRFLNALAKWTLPRADTWRVVNTLEKEKYVRLSLPAQNIHVLPVSVNLNQFMHPPSTPNRASLRANWGVESDTIVLLWVGRPVEFKNVPLLVNAVHLLMKQGYAFHLVLVGDFGSASEIPVLVETLGLQAHTTFCGAIAHAQLAPFYTAADIYLHSSNYEGFGRVLVEAAASGLAIVATQTAGALDILQHAHTALLSPPYDVSAFAENIRSLVESPELRKKLAQTAQAEICQRFDPHYQSQQVVRAWLTTIQSD
ncbi:MAG TPA: glycosyltransferase family 4 protein [Anaerolineales bacterium]|nr:glycosyltransferase family 4 protein [Anaerolineales bacterium]